MRPTRILAVLTVGILLASTARAQRPRPAVPLHYDTATVQTFSAHVLEVRTPAPGGRGTAGVQLLVQAGADTMPVHLAPSWVLQQQGVVFAPGDSIAITGSRVQIADAPAIVAAEVRKGDSTLRLRDRRGVPRWSPRRRGP